MGFSLQDEDPMRAFSFQTLLSDPKYAIFDFAPGETHTLSTEEDRLVAGHLTDTLMVAFLDKINFEYHQPSSNKQILADLKAWTDENMIPLCGGDARKIKAVTKAMHVSAILPDYFFPHATHRARLLIAMATTAGISLDDFVGDAEHSRFASFASDLMMGKPISDGWLGMYTKMMREYISYFSEEDPRPGALGGESLVKFLSSTALEDQFSRPDTLPPHLCPTTDPHGCCPEGFPYWHRYQSGASGAYVPPLFHSVPFDYWVTSVPHLVRYTNFSNDLLSFQKEMLSGGELDMNYMSLQILARRQARVPSRFGSPGSAWTYRDALCEVMDETYQTVYDLDRAFVEFPKHCDEEQRRLWNMDYASRAWTAYKNGNISMHIDGPRWGLKTLRDAVRDKEAWAKLKREAGGRVTESNTIDAMVAVPEEYLNLVW